MTTAGKKYARRRTFKKERCPTCGRLIPLCPPDDALLEALAGGAFETVNQLAQHFGTSEPMLRNAMHRLKAAGKVHRVIALMNGAYPSDAEQEAITEALEAQIEGGNHPTISEAAGHLDTGEFRVRYVVDRRDSIFVIKTSLSAAEGRIHLK